VPTVEGGAVALGPATLGPAAAVSHASRFDDRPGGPSRFRVKRSSVGAPPFSVLTTINLRHAKDIPPRLSVDRRLSSFVTRGESHVPIPSAETMS
jgi:hypothetical protein